MQDDYGPRGPFPAPAAPSVSIRIPLSEALKLGLGLGCGLTLASVAAGIILTLLAALFGGSLLALLTGITVP